MTTKRNSSLAALLLALAGALFALVACGASQSPATPTWADGVNPTLRGTLDALYVDTAATQIVQIADMTVQAREAERYQVQTQVAAGYTATALTATADAAARETQTARLQQTQTAQRQADETATQHALLTLTAQAQASETAVAIASATAVMSHTREALIWQQTVQAATVSADSTAQSARATAVAVDHRIEQENNTALMWTLLTWTAGLIGVLIAGLAVYGGVRAFLNWEQRRHAVDLGNGQSVWYEDVEELLPGGRRVKRRVLIDPQRMLGPVVDVSARPLAPTEGALERTSARALFTNGWVESTRAQAAGQALAAQAGTNGKTARSASPTPALPPGGEVFLSPVNQTDRPQVIVIERPEEVRQLIPPAQLAAIEADWVEVDEGGDDNDD